MSACSLGAVLLSNYNHPLLWHIASQSDRHPRSDFEARRCAYLFWLRKLANTPPDRSPGVGYQYDWIALLGRIHPKSFGESEQELWFQWVLRRKDKSGTASIVLRRKWTGSTHDLFSQPRKCRNMLQLDQKDNPWTELILSLRAWISWFACSMLGVTCIPKPDTPIGRKKQHHWACSILADIARASQLAVGMKVAGTWYYLPIRDMKERVHCCRDVSWGSTISISLWHSHEVRDPTCCLQARGFRKLGIAMCGGWK